MTLRQALTAAAAAAVIAPAAVLVTPAAASATEAPRPSAHTDESQKTAGPERGGDSARTEGATGPGESSGTGGPTAGTDEATKPGAGKDAGKNAKPAPDAKPGEETGTEPGATSGGSSSGEVPRDGQCESSSQQLQMAIKGLQSGFVAGAGWSNSAITVTNTSDKAMEKVRPQPYISSAEIVDRPYEELEAQFRNPVTGKWLSFEDATVDSVFTGFPVAAHSTVTLPLRVRAINSAKPGAGYAIVEGMFSHQDGSCGLSNHEQYDFKILPAHGKPGGPSKPDKPGKPGKPGRPSESAEPAGGATDGGPRPQGGAKETSGAGQLAATGSSSALPTITLVGGVAMAVGAGAIISVRRRKAPAGSSGGGTGATALGHPADTGSSGNRGPRALAAARPRINRPSVPTGR